MKTLEELFHVSETCTCARCTTGRLGAQPPIFVPVLAPISRSEFSGLQAENARLRQELADEKQSGIEAFARWQVFDADQRKEIAEGRAVINGFEATARMMTGDLKKYGQHKGACPSKPCECGFEITKEAYGI